MPDVFSSLCYRLMNAYWRLSFTSSLAAAKISPSAGHFCGACRRATHNRRGVKACARAMIRRLRSRPKCRGPGKRGDGRPRRASYDLRCRASPERGRHDAMRGRPLAKSDIRPLVKSKKKIIGGAGEKPAAIKQTKPPPQLKSRVSPLAKSETVA